MADNEKKETMTPQSKPERLSDEEIAWIIKQATDDSPLPAGTIRTPWVTWTTDVAVSLCTEVLRRRKAASVSDEDVLKQADNYARSFPGANDTRISDLFFGYAHGFKAALARMKGDGE